MFFARGNPGGSKTRTMKAAFVKGCETGAAPREQATRLKSGRKVQGTQKQGRAWFGNHQQIWKTKGGEPPESLVCKKKRLEANWGLGKPERETKKVILTIIQKKNSTEEVRWKHQSGSGRPNVRREKKDSGEVVKLGPGQRVTGAEAYQAFVSIPATGDPGTGGSTSGDGSAPPGRRGVSKKLYRPQKRLGGGGKGAWQVYVQKNSVQLYPDCRF